VLQTAFVRLGLLSIISTLLAQCAGGTPASPTPTPPGASEAPSAAPSVGAVATPGRQQAYEHLLSEIPAGTAPLSPENKLVFMTSVVTGAPISGQGRHTAAALSPLTGGLADSQCGGWWGAELKFAGYDGIIVEGRAAAPV
jgi:aldehyde:ferredoxin oxidoreductase